MFPGPVMQLRLVNKAGQLQSGWDAIPQWPLKITSCCQGAVNRNRARPSTCLESASDSFVEKQQPSFCTNRCHIQSCRQSDSREIVFKPSDRLSYFLFLHSNCSEGTCDGCTFHFLWQSQHACPLCTKNHYREIVSACIQGIQVMLHTHRHSTKNPFNSSSASDPSSRLSTFHVVFYGKIELEKSIFCCIGLQKKYLDND